VPESDRLTPVQAARAYCLTTCGFTKSRTGLHGAGEDEGECGNWWSAGYCVLKCGRKSCPLHAYRLGKQPGRAGIGGRPAKVAT
jgi:hypothetical protein